MPEKYSIKDPGHVDRVEVPTDPAPPRGPFDEVGDELEETTAVTKLYDSIRAALTESSEAIAKIDEQALRLGRLARRKDTPAAFMAVKEKKDPK